MARMVEFPGPGGRVRGFVAKPEKPAPGVLILHPGKLEELEAFCERLAAEDFVALVPDLTHGQPAVRDASSLDGQTAAEVAASAIGLLLGQSGLEGKRAGILAFGAAASVAAQLASLTPQTIGAVALFGGEGADEVDHLEMPVRTEDAVLDPTRPESVDEESAAKAWRTTLEFFRENLTPA